MQIFGMSRRRAFAKDGIDSITASLKELESCGYCFGSEEEESKHTEINLEEPLLAEPVTETPIRENPVQGKYVQFNRRKL